MKSVIDILSNFPENGKIILQQSSKENQELRQNQQQIQIQRQYNADKSIIRIPLADEEEEEEETNSHPKLRALKEGEEEEEQETKTQENSTIIYVGSNTIYLYKCNNYFFLFYTGTGLFEAS